MAITQRAPNTIWLGPGAPCRIVAEYRASAAVTPGHLVEFHDDSSEIKVRKNASATEIPTLAVALDAPDLNKGIADDYAAGDEVRVAFLCPGDFFYGLIPSGQNISYCELLQSNGDGTLKSATATTADAMLARFQSLDAPGSVSVATRIRVQVIC